MKWMCESILKLDWKITPNSLQQSNPIAQYQPEDEAYENTAP